MKRPKPISNRELAHNKLLKYKINELIRYVIYLTDKVEDIEIELEGCKRKLGLK